MAVIVHVAGTGRWVAAVRSAELVDAHIAFVRLFDDEFAVWRDAAGRANAWENRCPHRGMRLTLGTNTGESVICRYHGWRFGAGSGACRFIPAHPRQIAPRAAAVRTYPTFEKYGFVWIGLGEVSGEPEIPGIGTEPSLTFRSLPIHAPFAAVRAALLREDGAAAIDDGVIRTQLSNDGHTFDVVFLATAQSAQATIVHGFAVAQIHEAERLPLLRQQNERLKRLRVALETERFAQRGEALATT